MASSTRTRRLPAHVQAARDHLRLSQARAHAMKRSHLWFLYGIVMLISTLASIEGAAWLVTPAWPGYMLRPAPIGVDAVAQWSGGMPEVVFATNRWLMRDRERSIGKPATVEFRSIFVGDSFLEGGFTRAA